MLVRHRRAALPGPCPTQCAHLPDRQALDRCRQSAPAPGPGPDKDQHLGPGLSMAWRGLNDWHLVHGQLVRARTYRNSTTGRTARVRTNQTWGLPMTRSARPTVSWNGSARPGRSSPTCVPSTSGSTSPLRLTASKAARTPSYGCCSGPPRAERRPPIAGHRVVPLPPQRKAGAAGRPVARITMSSRGPSESRSPKCSRSGAVQHRLSAEEGLWARKEAGRTVTRPDQTHVLSYNPLHPFGPGSRRLKQKVRNTVSSVPDLFSSCGDRI